MLLKIKSRTLATLGTFLLFLLSGGLLAQTVTGSFSPPSTGASSSSTLTLNYAGFTSNSVGLQLRVYYNSVAVTPGTFVASTPPGQSQPQLLPAPGILATCAGADTFVTLNWIDFGSTWPTPTSGTLGTFPFTTAAGFTASTNVCWVDDIGAGAPARNITGSTVLQFTVAPAVSIAAAPPSINDALTGNVSTITVSSNQTAPAGGITVNLTPPPANARYSTTCGATIVILASTTSRTCTVTATNNTTAGDGNVSAPVTLVAGAGYTITHNLPANGAFKASGLVSNYTLVMDVLWPSASDGAWRALMQTNPANSDDADWFVKNAASGGIGISQYFGSLQPNTWYRIAMVVDAKSSGASLQFYINGAPVGGYTNSAGQRFALGSQVLVFTDNDNETAAGYGNAILISDRSWTQSEIAALGGPSAIMAKPTSSALALRTLAPSIAGGRNDLIVNKPQPTRKNTIKGTNEFDNKADKLKHE